MSNIEEILARERNKSKLDISGLSTFLYGTKQLKQIAQFYHKPLLDYDFNLYNKSRTELIKHAFNSYLKYFEVAINYPSTPSLMYLIGASHQSPTTIHAAMFVKCIEYLGTQTQQQEWFKKAARYEIIGCYAQTQLGHGSDVQNLETTATYVVGKDQFIINTPSVSAAKYWPGDLGIVASHALVFAQLIVHGQKHGVHPFIVPIRDQKTFQSLPGIEVGDIGPKIGFHTKDNGYLILHNCIIPKRNMLRKFVSVGKNGQIKKKGDPKVSYATMMIIRQTISCLTPKIYGQVITIAARYSLFRTQFLNESNQQISIIEYQTQQDKIVTRLAEYFAVIVAGNAIKKISEDNLQNVTKRNDFSLMNETHICLCLGKAFFTETVYQGMEICRRACGGHGFSHYSGLPSILSQYSSNLTYEGQNTILYLQVTRFLLKNYKYYMTKRPVANSTKYFLKFQQLLNQKLSHEINSLSIENIQFLLGQAACYLISQLAAKLLNKPEGYSDLDVWNELAGVDIKKVALAHSIFYTFSKFKEAVLANQNSQNRQILINLCLLYGTHVLINQSPGAIQGGFLTAIQISRLKRLKESYLKVVKNQIIPIVDSFILPEHHIRSELTYGNPYENFLKSARLCQLNNNDDVAKSARETLKKISKIITTQQAKL